jgi:ribosomal protein S18 acetylase RimI-like enzyme
MTASFVTEIEGASISGALLRELARTRLAHGKPFRFTAHGYSMLPFIQDGDMVTLAPFAGAPQVGEVVALIHPEHHRLIVHRLVQETPGGFVLQGDNIAQPDGAFAATHLLGRVVRVERNGRAVSGGLGAGRAAIAFLSRQRILAALKAAWYLPRRAASALLRAAQGRAAYRALGRRWQPRFIIAEARDDELAEAQRRLNPGVWTRPAPRNPHVTGYVAHAGGNLAGFIELVRHPPEHVPYVGHWLFSLHVWTRYRGLGIGAALTQRVIAQTAAEGAAELRLVVFADNVRAIRLYRKLGFAPITVPALEPQLAAEGQSTGRRRIVMRKQLSPDVPGTYEVPGT